MSLVVNDSTDSGNDLLFRVRKRIAQGVKTVRPALPPDTARVVAATLTARQAEAFACLPAFDQAHLVRVQRWLEERGVDKPELLQAALLHDIGKVDGETRVRTIDRVARVVLRAIAPGLMERLAAWPAPSWRRGFALAVHHPALGAEKARAVGCSDRVCWLIAHHETYSLAEQDSDLALLMAADRAS